MYKKYLKFIILVVIVILGVASFFIYKKLTIPKKVHYHAGIIVYKDNKKLDFSGFQYMNIKPCSLKQSNDDSDADIQLEKAHLHDNVGDVAHIERDGAVWRDLFTNIHFPIDYSSAIGYINGEKIDHFENQRIHAYDSLAVFIGKNNVASLPKLVDKNYIQKVEKKSGLCSE